MSATAERMTTVEVLRKALELLGPNGEYWRQREFEDDKGMMCAVGAINKAQGEKPYRVTYVERFLRSTLPVEERYKAVTVFNDTHTFAEIKAAFLRAIELAEASR